MIADCVGLDLGRTAIKAVRFRRRLSGRESVEYFHQPLPYAGHQDLDQARVAKVLQHFLWKHGFYHEDVVTAIPCQDLLIRTLSFPFRDVSKIQQVVPFEVENLIPLPLEDVAVGNMLLPPAPVKGTILREDGSDVLVTAAPRVTVEEHVRFMAQADLTPAAVNVDGLALFSVTHHLKQGGALVPPDLAVIDIGASKTTLCLIHEGRPWLLRSIPWGGDEITELLAARMGATFADAERYKRSKEVSVVETWFDPLVREIRLSLHAYQTTTQTRIEHCWVSGGGSKLREMSEYLPRRLELAPVGPRQGFGADCPRAFSIAFGLAIHPKIVGSRFKVRRAGTDLALDLKQLTEDAAPQTVHSARELWWWAIAGLLLAVLAIADLYAHVSLKEARVKDLKTALQVSYKQQFGGDAFPGEELDQARFKTAAVTKAVTLIDGASDKKLPILAQLVKQLPRGIPVKVRELTLEQSTAHLEAETTTFESVEKVKQALSAGPIFKNVTVGDSRMGASASQVVFRVTLTVQTP